ncbi:unnamed protein product [Chondrus crispus]|uniref:AMP-dependent synthetase/ligase domain-containing protein n=1 Tax=Chondrus crispus TaxID=2769 RepID=R7QNK6_CHOCR|nr:unnamed protein product [Chondrus crispus]CDF39046.1 unnamed protein product [Chondrus crispus]|eukprot:XP_005718957.1 unnamed protein product [Chondrus crispus]
MSPSTSYPVIHPSHPALQALSPSDRHLFCKYASGPRQSPAFPTVLAAFEQMVITHPHAVSATEVLENGELNGYANITYAQLDAQANKLASLMHARGVSNGDAVCLFLKRSVQMIVGIIASLKVGACYVPQHVGLTPDTQLLNVADATSAKVVLTMDELQEKLPEFPPHVSVIPIGSVMRDATLSTAEPPLSRPVRPSDRCYIIFTSGTTGAPKGVQVTHANVANVLLTSPMDLGMAPGVRVGQILSIAFDMGAWEILGCLSHGATLMTHVKTVAVAGEPCPRGLAATWGKFATFYNSCGPTETTIVNTAKRFDPESIVLTIGKPTPNNTVYVLDPDTLEPCNIGEVGEMWAGGECVSAGYLNKSGLTAERYLVDPFINSVNSFMYKTGDLGRWDANGELEHYGRVDDQVKVKGFRVELDGVSAMAETAYGVEKAVVLKIGTELVAFVTPECAKTEAVKEAVGIKLPYYCVPSRVVRLGALPKTGNGKVDKRALKETDARKVLQLMFTRRPSSHISRFGSGLRTERML